MLAARPNPKTAHLALIVGALGVLLAAVGIVAVVASRGGSHLEPRSAGNAQSVPTATGTPTPPGGQQGGMRVVAPLVVREGFPPTATPTPTPDPAAAASRYGGLAFWAGGDSTSYFMNLALQQAFLDAGASLALVDYTQSSGLANTGFYDWPSRIAAAMTEYDPDVAVFMIGANDWGIPGNGDTALANYRTTVGNVMELLAEGDRIVVWVGQPAMGPAYLADLPVLNAIFATEAAKRDNVYFLDTVPLTTDANGAYSDVVPGAGGETVVARAADGVHFTFAGAAVLANGVLDLIDAVRAAEPG